MRYLLQLLIPLLLFILVVYVLGRRGRQVNPEPDAEHTPSELLPSLAILTIGAGVAIVALLVMQMLLG